MSDVHAPAPPAARRAAAGKPSAPKAGGGGGGGHGPSKTASVRAKHAAMLGATHRGGGHEEGGEGNWLVSYADMMTLLVGFFVILLSFSTIDQKKLEELKLAATREFGGTYQVPYGDIADRIREALNKAGFGDQFVIKQDESGLEISFRGTVFFDSGSAEMKDGAKLLMAKLIPIIQKETRTFDCTIEGHTDDVPVAPGSEFRNNWELSSVRACRVLEALEAAGFPREHLTAVGYGDARPVVANRDAQGNALPENRSQNRRVVIKLLKKAESVAGGAVPEPAANPGQS